MCRAFQPFTMQGIYFSLKTSFQIKISPFHLSLLQSHHILREQKPRFAKKHFLLLYKLWRNLKKFFRFEEQVFLPTRAVNCCKQEYQFKRLRHGSLLTMD